MLIGLYSAAEARALTLAPFVVEAAERARLHLPDADRLETLGDLFARGWDTPADLAAVQAIPAAYLRANSTVHHYALFVAARQHP